MGPAARLVDVAPWRRKRFRTGDQLIQKGRTSHSIGMVRKPGPSDSAHVRVRRTNTSQDSDRQSLTAGDQGLTQRTPGTKPSGRTGRTYGLTHSIAFRAAIKRKKGQRKRMRTFSSPAPLGSPTRRQRHCVRGSQTSIAAEVSRFPALFRLQPFRALNPTPNVAVIQLLWNELGGLRTCICSEKILHYSCFLHNSPWSTRVLVVVANSRVAVRERRAPVDPCAPNKADLVCPWP